MNPSLPIYSGRFALLWHELAANPAFDNEIDNRTGLVSGRQSSSHWDLLLELDGSQLLTWRLPSVPLDKLLKPGNQFSALRLANHRALYLDYEGPVSGNRGSVTRVAGGVYQAEILIPKLPRDGAAAFGIQASQSSKGHTPIPVDLLNSSEFLRVILIGLADVRSVFQVRITAAGQDGQVEVLE